MSKPPHFVWPAVVIALLLLSGITTFGVLIASRSDGGVQVVDDYYRRSVAWDSVAATHRASDSLGWHVEVRLVDTDAGERLGEAIFTDRDGQFVDELGGTVTVTRPQSAVTFGTHRFLPAGSSGEPYRFDFPYAERGLWDLDIVASRNGTRFIKRIRIEI